MANVSGSAKPASAASEISDIALHEFLSDHFTALLLAQSDRDCYQNALNSRRNSRLIIVIDTGILQISSVTHGVCEGFTGNTGMLHFQSDYKTAYAYM